MLSCTWTHSGNTVSPTVEQLREVKDRLLLHDDGGYAYVNTSSVAGSAYAMVRVLPGRRRRGIGSALLEAAVAAARELGTASAWGYVLPGDEGSLSFATARGFREVGRRERLGKLHGVWRDVVLLERRSQFVGVD